MIFYSQEYHSGEGATIIQNHIVDGLPPSNFPQFLGVGYIKIPTPMGEVDEKINVPIDAKDLREAFSKFRETMERDGPAEVQRAVNAFKNQLMEMQKQQQSRIVTAGQVPQLPPFQGLVKP